MNAFPISLPGAAAAVEGAGISANPLGQPMAGAASPSPYSTVASELTVPITVDRACAMAALGDGDSQPMVAEGEVATQVAMMLPNTDSEAPLQSATQPQVEVETDSELAAPTLVALPSTVTPPQTLPVSTGPGGSEEVSMLRSIIAPVESAGEPPQAAVAAPAALLAQPDKAAMALPLTPAAVTTAVVASAAPLTVIPEQLEARVQLAAARSKSLPVAAIDTGVGSAGSTAAGVSVWGPMTVTKSGDQALLAREMLAPLGDQIRFNLEQGIKRAEVRLDPPDLGRIELTIRQEGDRISVQLHAANPQVRDALANGAERLRQEMMQQFDGQVDVDVGQHQPEQQQHSQSWDERILAAEHHEMSRPEDEHDIIDMLA